MANDAPTIDSKQYRQVLGQYPTGVCVVSSTGDDGQPAGMVIGSFTSVSLDPPLVAFFPDKNSSSWPKVAVSGLFCVSILSADQEPVCRTLASKDADKFATISHSASPLGSPIIDGAVAWIDCTMHSIEDAGDHFAVFGRVHRLEIAEAGLPLLFFQGGYGRFAPSSLAASDQHGLLAVQLRQVDRARRNMELLAAELSAVCVASAQIGNEVVIIASAGQPRTHAPVTLVGQRLPFVPPTGSVFAAWMDDRTADEWIARCAAPGQADACRSALVTVRDRGFSVGLASDAHRTFAARLIELAQGGTETDASDLGALIGELVFDPPNLDETSSRAVRLVSVPVFGADGCVAFALTLHDFDRPASAADVERLAQRLLKTAAEASADLSSAKGK